MARGRNKYNIEIKREPDNWVHYSGPFDGTDTAHQLGRLKQLFPKNVFRKVRG